MLAKHKRRIEELEEQLRGKTEQINELLKLNETQQSLEDKMKLIDLTSKTKLDVELEAANRIKELLNEK